MHAVQKTICIFFSLLMLAQCVLIRKRLGTWLFPGCIFSLFWFLATFIPLIALWSIPAEPLSVAYILICTIAFSLGSVRFDWKHAFAANRVISEEERPRYDTWFLKGTFYVLTAVVLLSITIHSLYQGISVYDIVFNLMESSQQYAQMRYDEALTPSIFGQLSIVLMYVTVILGGLLVAHAKKASSRWTLIVLSFFPSAFVMLTQSAKGALLLAVVLFYGSVLICRISKNDLVLVRGRSSFGLVVFGGVLAALIVVSFLSRGLYESDDSSFVVDRLLAYMASYSSGHLYGFSDWFSDLLRSRSVNYYAPYQHSYGFYTFMPVFKLLGSEKTVPLGIFDEYLTYGDTLSTNIYTIFRGLIMDFGVIGSVVYMLVTGWFFHASFYVLLTSRRPVISVAIFVFMLGYIYTTSLISILIWGTIYASFALLCVVLYANDVLCVSESPSPSVT